MPLSGDADRLLHQQRRWLPQGHALGLIEIALWCAGVSLALLFALIKIGAWGPLDAPEQSDFAVEYYAARVLDLSPVDLYVPQNWAHVTGVRESGSQPYLYLPTFAWLLRPLAALDYDVARRIWFWGSVLTFLAVIICLRRMGRKDTPGVWAIVMWLLLPGTLDTLYLGQVNAFLALMVTLGIMGFAAQGSRAPLLGGVLIGVAGSIKIFPLAVAALTPWGKKWSFAAGVAIGLAGMILLGIVGSPAVTWGEFLRVLLKTVGQSAPPGAEDALLLNQSLLGFWRKLAFSGDVSLTLQGRDIGSLVSHALLPSSVANVVGYGSVTLVVAVTALALWRLHRASGNSMPVVWSLILITALIVSPYTWGHYLVITAAMFLGLMDAQQSMPVGWRLLPPIGYLLVVSQRGIVWVLSIWPLIALSSLLLAGLLLWWLVLVRHAIGLGSVQRASGH